MPKGNFNSFPEAMSIKVENHKDLASVDEHNDNFDDSEFLQDVPYSSSSVDRSSIGSIPWADDAIKKNQFDWEYIERMISGEDDLPEELDLRCEILEWQKKFPFLVTFGEHSNKKNKLSFAEHPIEETASRLNSIDAEINSNISADSFDSDKNNDQYGAVETPTASIHRNNGFKTSVSNGKSASEQRFESLSAKLGFLRISAIPLRPHQWNRRNDKLLCMQSSTEQEHSNPSATMQFYKEKPGKHMLVSPPNISPTNVKGKAHTRMPPVLVLESKRRFRDLKTNKSFVQLTHITPPQAKSAAMLRQQDSVLQLGQKQHVNEPVSAQCRGNWQKPLMAARISHNFINNRNAIILPALNLQHYSGQIDKTISDTAVTGTQYRSSSYSTHSPSLDLSPPLEISRHAPSTLTPRWQHLNGFATSTSTGTFSTGRSISAAVHHPRHEIGEMYTPYSMYKYGGFK